jgi:membrane protein
MKMNFRAPRLRSWNPQTLGLFLSSVGKKFQRDNAFFLARGLAFDVLVCLIPALFLLFVLFGFLFDSSRETIQYMSSYMKSMIPFSQQQVLRNLFSVVKNQKVLGVLGGIGIVWTLSRLFASIRTVLDTVFEVKKGRGFLRGKIFDLKMMGVGSLFLLATVLVTSLSSLVKQASPQALGVKFLYLGVRGELSILFLGFVFTVCLFFFLYKFVPHQRIQNREALYAALAASVLWELAKQVFRFYLLNVADWNKVYGSFTLLFALILWVYYSCIVFILGAEMGWVWSRKKKTGE